jgi:hypothetical protein
MEVEITNTAMEEVAILDPFLPSGDIKPKAI